MPNQWKLRIAAPPEKKTRKRARTDRVRKKERERKRLS